MCEVLLVRDPPSKRLDSLISGLFVYSDERFKCTMLVYRASGTETSSVGMEAIQKNCKKVCTVGGKFLAKGR